MKLKENKTKLTELIYLIAGAVLTLLLLIYIVFLVKNTSGKVRQVLDLRSQEVPVESYNFDKYDQIIEKAGISVTTTILSPSTTEEVDQEE
ncbi:MAG: hypothetical protein COU06_01840 [Candidatus Harrisonbacteria bacterium CG10_big_fil_rev_8_21_14_0_10_38_8]|uniref:Uncharacterized protein n=1 Tax=Candidatus Harrisonbacteria bacterium CG10_big_fil_rev_8_21_14_0_10_38_8 TaxID=1974582 RepID=A0A2M6WK07_9BACT|nr:MAG: hypothetical protein COU06_01840 [Candidatus Harrisonbacteria bacterium CG10_big_fil_rev_8_21_14_0_10_38_8]